MAADNPYQLYSQPIIQATQEGRVTDWIERIASIARLAELPMSAINWNGSPQNVVHEVITRAKANCRLTELGQAISQYCASKPAEGS